LVELEKLKPHEEVIEKVVQALSEEIRDTRVVHDPLMVDQDDYVILDGMHRYNSLKQLNCRFAPCCLLDYDSPQIKVGSWFRLFTVSDPTKLTQTVLGEMKLEYSRKRVNPSIMDYDTETLILTGDGDVYSFPSSLDSFERCRIATRVEKRIVNDGHDATYLSETIAMQHLKSGQANLVIALPIFSKDEIREFGLEKRLLPHKVTRHIIPSRPLEIDAPLELLLDPNISCQEADRKLGDLLARRKVEKKPPGSVVDGRHYDEELLVFSG
jgi:hypothetical protein